MADHMFVRFLNRAAVKAIVAQMAREFGAHPEKGDPDGITTIKAPDGDTVFQAIRKDGAGNFICRFHDEVFNREPKT